MFCEKNSLNDIILTSSEQAFLEEIGIKFIYQLLYMFPYRYEQSYYCNSLLTIKEKYFQYEKFTICVSIKRLYFYFKERETSRVECVDVEGNVVICTWFNCVFLRKVFKEGMNIKITGSFYNQKNVFMSSHPDFVINYKPQEKLCDHLSITARYKSTNEKKLKLIIKKVLIYYSSVICSSIPDYLTRIEHFWNIHSPRESEDIMLAQRFFALERIFFISSIIEKRRRTESFLPHQMKEYDVVSLCSNVQFQLRKEQIKAVKSMKGVAINKPIFRILLHGEVGSGKTITAFVFSLLFILNKKRVVFLEPTVLLAHQTFNKLQEYCTKFNIKYSISLVTYETKDKNVDVDIIVGTHALLSLAQSFTNLGLVVIDEEQKFGVNQRELIASSNDKCNFLFLSATPIPRTLSLVMQRDIDVVFLKGEGRQHVLTKILEIDNKLFQIIKHNVTIKRKSLIVLPFILIGKNEEIQNISSFRDVLRSIDIEEKSFSILHGKLNKDEQKYVFDTFVYSNEKILLIATSIAELGIDIAALKDVFIFHPHIFGLSALHQIRGRVGRSSTDEANCFLCIPQTIEEKSLQRIKAFLEVEDGFSLSKLDLFIRGSGDIFGIKQTGHFGHQETGDIYTNVSEYLKEMSDNSIEMIACFAKEVLTV